MRKAVIFGCGFLLLFNPIFLKAQLTIGDVFDFEINDQFHIEPTVKRGTPSGYIKTLLSKKFSQREDSLIYSWKRTVYSSVWDEDIQRLVFQEQAPDTFQEIYTNLDSPIFYLHFYKLLAQFPDSSVFLNTVPNYDSLPNEGLYGDTLSLYLSQYCNYFGATYEVTYGPITFEPNSEKRIYAKGLGLLHFNKYEGAGGQHGGSGWKVIYFKKGNSSCGEKVYNSLNEKTDIRLNVYPNPFRNYFQVSTEGSFNKVSLSVFNSAGCLVHYEEKKAVINPTFVVEGIRKEGIYFYQLIGDGLHETGSILMLD